MAKYICFDTETTGLDANIHNLLTGCFIILDFQFNELDRLNISLKSDNYTINVESMQVNKINIINHHNNNMTRTNLETKKKLTDFITGKAACLIRSGLHFHNECKMN